MSFIAIVIAEVVLEDGQSDEQINISVTDLNYRNPRAARVLREFKYGFNNTEAAGSAYNESREIIKSHGEQE